MIRETLRVRQTSLQLTSPRALRISESDFFRQILGPVSGPKRLNSDAQDDNAVERSQRIRIVDEEFANEGQ